MTQRRGMNNVTVIVLTAGLIYLGHAIAMGVIPGTILSATKPVPHLQAYGADALRGRAVYVAEGCSYCHTQQVRPLEQDRVWGRPSAAGDYAYDTPQLLGTERTGPDLANVAARQPSKVWHLIHLYQPRALVHASIMPAYPWLYTEKAAADPGDTVVQVPPGYAEPGKVVVASQRALDLVAYLQSLKQTALPTPRPMP
jgi:cytochrome c oxidase cbb3-type subunit II